MPWQRTGPCQLHLATWQADEKNLFVGMGSKRGRPGVPAVIGGHGEGFGNNGDNVFTSHTVQFGNGGRSVGRYFEEGGVGGVGNVSLGSFTAGQW